MRKLLGWNGKIIQNGVGVDARPKRFIYDSQIFVEYIKLHMGRANCWTQRLFRQVRT